MDAFRAVWTLINVEGSASDALERGYCGGGGILAVWFTVGWWARVFRLSELWL